MTAVIVQLRDYHLRRLTREAAELAGELVRFAKEGEPIVANADSYVGTLCPEGIEDLPGVFPDWDVG